MLDRLVVEDFLDAQFSDSDTAIPKNINKQELVETFSLYVEDDLYEWLKDNYKSFFDHGDPDWELIEERIARYKRENPANFKRRSSKPAQTKRKRGK